MNKILKNTRYIRITDDTCRICLRETPMGKKVLRNFQEVQDDLPDEQLTLGQIYEICTGYKPTYGPMQVCIVCEASLKQLFLFRLDVDNSEKALRAFEEPPKVTTMEVIACKTEVQEDDTQEVVKIFSEEDEFEEQEVEQEEYEEAEEEEALNVSEIEQEVHVEMEYQDGEQVEFTTEDPNVMIEERLEEEILTEAANKAARLSSKTCPICEKTFSTATHCEQHKKIHYGIKDFQCSDCSKWFRTLSQLKSHLSSHHDNRIYACESCPKKFKTKKTLKGHEETHSTEIRYFCGFCEQGYTNKTALRVHTLRRHRSPKDEPALKHEYVKHSP